LQQKSGAEFPTRGNETTRKKALDCKRTAVDLKTDIMGAMRRPEPNIAFILLIYSLACLPAFAGEEASKRITLKDSLGRTVICPGRVDRILSMQPEVTRLIVALGGGEKLVGVDYFIARQDHLFRIIFPPGERLPAVSNAPEDMNFEMVMRLAPDVIFVSPTELQMVEALEDKIKKPVIALASMGSFDKLLEEISLLGGILGREERSRVLSEFFNARLSTIRNSVTAVAAADIPGVYLSFWGSLLRTPVVYEPVAAAGGRNCASDLLPMNHGTIATVVQAEQILVWKPDIVLVQGNYPSGERIVTTEDVFTDRRFRSLPAVVNGRVFYTFGFWYWWDPAEVLLETVYLAHLFHPEVMGPLDLEKEGNEIFREFYGVDGAFSALCRALECYDWNKT
jgi:iron complex transport system substrate-binding protein